MKNYFLKLRLLFPSLFYALIVSVVTTVLLRWILDFELHIVNVRESYWVFGVSLFIGLISAIIFIRPASKLLLTRKDSDDTSSVWIIAGMIIWLFCWFAQYSLVAHLNKLVKIESVNEVRDINDTMYCEIEDFELSSKVAHSFTSLSVSGKNNSKYDIDVFFTFPMIENNEEPDSGEIWYGLKFHEQISNHKSDQEKELRYNSFVKECRDSISRFNFKSVHYFERIGMSDDLDNFERTIEVIRDAKPFKNDLILQAVLEPFVDKSKNSLGKGLLGVLGYAIFYLVLLVFFKLNESTYEEYSTKGEVKYDSAFEILNIFVPTEGHFITPIIIDLNILMFFVLAYYDQEFMSFSTESLILFGGNISSKIIDGEIWRFITNIFLHGGFMHLLYNSIALVVISALFIEAIFGKSWLLLIYLVSGIGGGITSFYWYDEVVSIGASGAIFGLFGCMLSLTAVKYFEADFSNSVLKILGLYAGVSFVYGLMTPGTDNAAHIGGLITGFLLGLIFYYRQKAQIIEV